MNIGQMRAVFAISGLCLLTLMPTIVQLPFTDGLMSAAQLVAWAASGTIVLLMVYPNAWVGVLLLSPFAFFAPFEAWYIVEYSRPSDIHLYGILSDTDPTEVHAFIGGLEIYLILFATVALYVICFAVVTVRRSKLEWSPRARGPLLVTAILAVGTPWMLDLLSDDIVLNSGLSSGPARPEVGDITVAMDPLFELFASAYPTGVPMRLVEFFQQRQATAHIASMLEDFKFGAKERETGSVLSSQKRRVHILVIGETGRPDRWKASTSPRLLAEPNTVGFQDMISPWAWTRMSVPVLITRKSANELNASFSERSVVSAYREAGFTTFWLSTQSSLGRHDSSFALHAREAHETRFLNAGSYKVKAAMDGDLLPALDRILARNEPRQLIVLHTLGSHYNYAHRYPPEFDVFKPSLKDHPAPSLHDREQREMMSNSYDNSILYTDHVLGEVIARLKKLNVPATMLYAADHGENLFDGECKLSGHGRNTERDFRIASFFWYSDSYAKIAPEIVKNARAHANSRLATTQLFYSMLDLGDIEIPGAPSNNSIFRADMKPPVRWVQNGLDFDTAVRDPVCKTLTAPPRNSAR